MSNPLEKSVGKILGSWEMFVDGFHNPAITLYLSEDGRVEAPNDIKLWALSGPNLLFFDDALAVSWAFQFKELQDGKAPVLQSVTNSEFPSYLRRCDENPATLKNRRMKGIAATLRDQVGKIEGVWGIHYLGFHNYPALYHFFENGVLEGSDVVKTWATAGSLLYLLDEHPKVKLVFQYKKQLPTTHLLEGVEVGKQHRYLLRYCGEPHTITAYYEGMEKAADINFLDKLKGQKDFSVEIEPQAECIVSLEQKLTVNRSGLYQRILDPAQPVSKPPIYFHVIRKAKIISGMVVQKTDGKCLPETAALSDICTAFFDHIHCYVDYRNRVQYFPEVPVKDKIEGICVYVENAAGMDHWLMQSLPSLYILDWLEEAGVDMAKVKLLFRRGFFNADHKMAFKASGWLDKIPESSLIDLAQLSPTIEIETLIYPSFLWIIIGSSMPPNFNFSLYPISQKVRPVFERIKQNILAKIFETHKYSPHIYCPPQGHGASTLAE